MAIDFSKQEEGLTLVTLPSLESQKAIFKQYEEDFNSLVKVAKDLVVVDEKSAERAIELGTSAKKMFKEFEVKRKDIISDPATFVKDINAFCKRFTDPLGKIEAETKGKMNCYQARVEQERRIKEAQAQKAARELQEKLNAEAKEEGVEPEKVQTQIVPKEKTIHRAEGGSAHQRSDMTFDPDKVELDKVPRKYLMLDEKKVRAAIKTGVKKIEGIKIYEKKSTVFRT